MFELEEGQECNVRFHGNDEELLTLVFVKYDRGFIVFKDKKGNIVPIRPDSICSLQEL